jgi:hypothetical protein
VISQAKFGTEAHKLADSPLYSIEGSTSMNSTRSDASRGSSIGQPAASVSATVFDGNEGFLRLLVLLMMEHKYRAE